MELQDILSFAIGALVTVVVAHFTVFYTVRMMYPPPPQVVMVPAAVAPVTVAAAPAYTPPAVTQQVTNVELPTYAPSVSVEAPREERKGPPAAEATSIRGKPGVDSANAQ